jgi:DUF4097 and DUF4098 domain-containing protein YvlB
MNGTILLLATLSMFRMGGDIHVADAPNGASLHTMGGDIRVEHGAGHIVAKTMGGNIEVERLDGSADLGTMGGNVTVSVTASGPGHDLELHSMGGEIELTVPRGFDGDFSVEIDDGDDEERHEIKSDVPLHVSESSHWFFGAHRIVTAAGRAGSGANRVRITTHGGDVTIRQR